VQLAADVFAGAETETKTNWSIFILVVRTTEKVSMETNGHRFDELGIL
jgi:hypothetical protein